jgi:(p)ppGpp synthase/HD superfamily hydrolase
MIEAMNGYSSRFDDALNFAACAHDRQVRKGSGDPGIPYIVHPVHVATILMRHGFDEDVVIAGLLHDTVEDTDASMDAVSARFGARVAELVGGVTEKKAEAGGEKRPWRVRKEEQLAHLGGADAPCAALKAADALHNCAATLADVRRDGAAVWGRFNASPADSVWYYREITRLCGARLGDGHALVRELAATVDALASLI